MSEEKLYDEFEQYILPESWKERAWKIEEAQRAFEYLKQTVDSREQTQKFSMIIRDTIFSDRHRGHVLRKSIDINVPHFSPIHISS